MVCGGGGGKDCSDRDDNEHNDEIFGIKFYLLLYRCAFHLLQRISRFFSTSMSACHLFMHTVVQLHGTASALSSYNLDDRMIIFQHNGLVHR